MIKIHVAAVNRTGLMQRDGCFASPEDWPQLLAGIFRSSTGSTSRCRRKLWCKRIRLIGSTLRNRTPEEKSAILKVLQEKLWPLFTAGKFITNIHAVFPLKEAEAAHGVLRRY